MVVGGVPTGNFTTYYLQCPSCTRGPAAPPPNLDQRRARSQVISGKSHEIAGQTWRAGQNR